MTSVTRTVNSLVPRIRANVLKRTEKRQTFCGYKTSQEVQYPLKGDKNLTTTAITIISVAIAFRAHLLVISETRIIV
jgi:hypothetical protein